MLLTWTRPESDPQEWIIKPRQMRSIEAELIEANGGDAWDTFDDWTALFSRGHKRAERVALWTLRRRTEPTLQLHQVDIGVNEILVRYDTEERREMRQLIRADKDLTDVERDDLLSKPFIALPEGEVDDEGPLPLPDSPPETTSTP